MNTTDRDTYLQQLQLSLRVREVSGPDIREWLDEVTAHLDDSGEAPLQEFGPPDELADRLLESRSLGADPRCRGTYASVVVGMVDGLLVAAGGILLLEAGFSAWAGEPTTLNARDLLLLLLLATGLPLLLPLLWRTMDGRSSWLRTWLVFCAFSAALVVVPSLVDLPLAELGRAPAVALGIVMAGVGAWRAIGRARRSVDRVPPSRLGR